MDERETTKRLEHVFERVPVVVSLLVGPPVLLLLRGLEDLGVP